MRRSFGNGPDVSVFTLGTMRAIESTEQMYAVAKMALNSGINHIETSPAYGSAEKFLGESLKRLNKENNVPKGGWLITNKILPGLSLEEGKQQLERSLNNLNLRKIHNLAVHGLNLPDHLEWTLKGAGADLLQWAGEENLINQVGFSSHGSSSLIQEAIESNRFQFCSLHLHLLDPRKIPLAKLALKKGMGVMAISPADKGGRLQDPSKTLINDCTPIHPLELAYRFLLAKGISTLTVGANTPRDLDLAKKLINQTDQLSDLENASLQRLAANRKERLSEKLCELCEACLPCPKGVPIPDLLNLHNLLIGHDLQAFTKERYNLIGKASHWWESIDASSCEKCRECIPLCPNNLDIPTLLENTHKQLKGKPKKRLWG